MQNAKKLILEMASPSSKYNDLSEKNFKHGEFKKVKVEHSNRFSIVDNLTVLSSIQDRTHSLEYAKFTYGELFETGYYNFIVWFSKKGGIDIVFDHILKSELDETVKIYKDEGLDLSKSKIISDMAKEFADDPTIVAIEDRPTSKYKIGTIMVINHSSIYYFESVGSAKYKYIGEVWNN